MFRPKMLVASLTAVRRSASLVNGLIARTASLIWLLSLQNALKVRRAPRPLRRGDRVEQALLRRVNLELWHDTDGFGGAAFAAVIVVEHLVPAHRCQTTQLVANLCLIRVN
jgi:hypothetical protein